MPGDSFTSRIRNLLRSPSTRQQRNRTESLSNKVTLEKVLGITAVGNSGLACDPRSGLVAYPAGCVVVLLNPKKNKQHHIVTPRKTITALSFSPDGKHLVTGECGHLPAVRLWDVSERKQVGELRMHDYGVSCVTFSPNGKYVVSVGNQHNMIVSVWAWKKDVVVAANKVSSKVTGVSFSEDSSYFVTVGNRHIKFWYLDQCKASKASTPVPLLGRSALLGELRNNFFCDVACGRGSTADSTFCITASGILCEFNSKRVLEKWVDLRVGAAHCLTLSSDMIFCGCADGTVRAFSPDHLNYICSLPGPHALGADPQSSHLLPPDKDARYPDAIAISYDPVSHWLSCVYNDHSVYVWDVRDVDTAVKVHAALFHAACIWDLEMFPGAPGDSTPAVFLSCSADNTVRLWHADDGRTSQHVSLGTDLRGIIYIDGNTGTLLDPECATHVSADKQADGQTTDSRTGIRSICVSPDGKHLASGDRNGMLRIHHLDSLEEVLKVEAHDAEILCVEYSKPETGLQLLATASRDRLIHVLDAAADYSLVQTLDEHSSSITAVRFAASDNGVRLISCGVDKSIYFRTAHKSEGGTRFHRTHHTVRKSTLYDMGVDPSCKYAAVGCQDRSIRIFNISSGKQKKLYKGSLSEDGSLLKVQLDPSGRYVATSCSNKNISIFDFNTGECVATMLGHSEIVTGMKFTNDCKHLISVSADSCIFVWRLAPELTLNMRETLRRLRQEPDTLPCSTSTIRREVYSAPSLGLSSDSDREPEEVDRAESRALTESEPDTGTNSSTDSSQEEDTGGSDEGNDWELRKAAPDSSRRPRRRWSPCMGSLDVMVKSMMDLRQLETFAPRKSPMGSPHSRDRQSMSSLQEVMLDGTDTRHRPWPLADAWLSSSPSSHSFMGTEETLLYCEDNEDDVSLRDSDDTLIVQHCRTQQRQGIHGDGQESRSPDSACSLGYDSRTSSPDHVLEDSGQADSSDEEKEQPKAKVTSVDEALRTVTGPADCSSQEDFLRHNFETLAQTSTSRGSSSSSSVTAEQSHVPKLSMSSRFLATGHTNRAIPPFVKLHGKDQGSLCSKPPVSKVRPLMEDGRAEKTSVLPGRGEGPRAGVVEGDQDMTIRSPKKKKLSASHLWHLSSPSPKSPLLDRVSCLQKSHSALNLASDPPLSPAPSGDQSEHCSRPQRLFLDSDSQKPSFLFSSPSSSSPQSPQPPQPAPSWESPKLKAHHSYMNPTASSMAKSSRSSSVGEGAHTPPCSPCFHRSRRSFGEPEAEAPLSASSPPSSTSSLSSGPQSASSQSPISSQPLAAVPPGRPVQNVQPSRIPLPKQPLSPRRSLCLEVLPSSRVSTPTAGPGGDVTPAPGKQALVRHLSLTLDPVLPSSIPVRQKRDSLLESPKETGQVAVAPECPLVSAEVHKSSHNAKTEDACITVEICREVVSELHNSLRKTVKLYTQVLQQPGEDHQEMRSILSETLLTVKAELDAMPEPVPPSEAASDGGKALTLLEQCAELLLKSVERRLDTKT